MDLERGLVAEPAQRPDPIGDEVLVGLALLDPDLLPAPQPGRRGAGDVLLPEPRRVRAVREALHVERSLLEVRQHRRGDLGEVADEVPLHDRLVAVPRREDDLVEVRDLQLEPADLPDAVLGHRLERGELFGSRLPGELLLRRGLLRAASKRLSLPARRGPSFRASSPSACAPVFDGMAASSSGSGTAASAASTAAEVAMACSRTTSVGGLPPSSRPLKAAWRTMPSRVQPPSSARITSSGRVQTTCLSSPPQRPL